MHQPGDPVGCGYVSWAFCYPSRIPGSARARANKRTLRAKKTRAPVSLPCRNSQNSAFKMNLPNSGCNYLYNKTLAFWNCYISMFTFAIY